MADTRVPGEGETPIETEQEMNLGQLRKRNPNLLWKVGSPAVWGHPMEHPSLQRSRRIKQLSGSGMCPIGIKEGAGLSEGLGETLHPLSVELLEQRGVQEETPPEYQLLWWGCPRPPLQPETIWGRTDTKLLCSGAGLQVPARLGVGTLPAPLALPVVPTIPMHAAKPSPAET